MLCVVCLLTPLHHSAIRLSAMLGQSPVCNICYRFNYITFAFIVTRTTHTQESLIRLVEEGVSKCAPDVSWKLWFELASVRAHGV